MVQLSPIFARPVLRPAAASRPNLPPVRPRLAGSSPQLPSLFSRVKGAASHLLGPALTAGGAAYELSKGRDPKQVALETAMYEGASTLGAGIGGVFGGPPGAIAGGILAPVVVGALDIMPKPVDIKGISTSELREIAGAPRVGGLSTPAPYEAPAVPDVVSQYLGNIDWSAVKPKASTTPARELASTQPVRDGAVRPAVYRAPEETHAPLTRPVSSAPISGEQTRQAVENEMLARAADQERTAELMRRMIELDVTGGMTGNDMRTWVSQNPDLAERLIADRLGRKERLAKEFAGFAEYAQ